MKSSRPHVLGIDDGPFDKRADRSVPIVGVMLEGCDLVEAVAITEFAVDGEGATAFLADWIAELRCAPALHAIAFSGMTIAGLGLVDAPELARLTGTPVVIVNRHEPGDERLIGALRAAALPDRIPIVERAPHAWCVSDGLFVSHAGATRSEIERTLGAVCHKSRLPEALRLAHLIGAAIVKGQSRGRP